MLPLPVTEGVSDWLGVIDGLGVPVPDTVCDPEGVTDWLGEPVADGLWVEVRVTS